MAIFLDSSRIEEIKKYHAMGIIRGVTTNPTLLFKEGLTGGMAGLKRCIVDIAALIDPYPVSAEVMTNDRQGMIDQSREIASWGANINVKITIHGPQGELDNLSVIHELEIKHNIRVNVTAMMSVQQCFLAAMAGASFVSIFAGRVNNMGYDASGEIRILRALLDQHQLKARIIAASTREVLNVTQWLSAGAHIVTVLPSLMEGMIVHPYSKETVKMFLDDVEKTK
ncbi:MAG: transaldolase [Candidatus Omnitrophica bacterium]|nr:transaldolase [Candidatus Omnitrophota bacterium]